MRALSLTVVLLLAWVGAGSCTTAPSYPSESAAPDISLLCGQQHDRDELQRRILRGTALLERPELCGDRHQLHGRLVRLFRAGDWRELGLQTAENAAGDGHAYFFLGMAAWGQKRSDLGTIYMWRAREAAEDGRHCEGCGVPLDVSLAADCMIGRFEVELQNSCQWNLELGCCEVRPKGSKQMSCIRKPPKHPRLDLATCAPELRRSPANRPG